MLPATASALRAFDAAGELTAVVGPCIHPECYEFGAARPRPRRRGGGTDVRARDGGGDHPALDLVAGVEHVLRSLDIDVPAVAVGLVHSLFGSDTGRIAPAATAGVRRWSSG